MRILVTAGTLLATAMLAATSASADEGTTTYFSTVGPDQNNAMYHLSPRYFPELAQSFTLTKPTSVSEVRFSIPGVTRVQPEWWTTPEATRHPLEQSVFSGTVPLDGARMQLWKAPTDGDLGPSLDLRQGFTKVAETSQDQPLTLGSWYSFPVSPALDLAPGTYVTTLWLDKRDPSIVTIYVAGRQSGNHTETGLTHTGPPLDCAYERATDSNPTGRVYRTAGPEIQFGPNIFTEPQPTFTEHAAKVNECIQVGRYGDIWNEGDVVMDLRGEAVRAPAGVKVNSGPRSITVTWKKNSAPGVVYTATASRGSLGTIRAGTCSAPASAGQCTIKNLKPGTRVYVSVTAKSGSRASAPTLQVAARVG